MNLRHVPLRARRFHFPQDLPLTNSSGQASVERRSRDFSREARKESIFPRPARLKMGDRVDGNCNETTRDENESRLVIVIVRVYPARSCWEMADGLSSWGEEMCAKS